MLDSTKAKWISFFITTLIFFGLGYMIWVAFPKNDISFTKPSDYMNTPEGLLLAFVPIILSILWSILKKRFLFIWGVAGFILHQIIINAAPVVCAANKIPYILYFGISYISCVVAICMDRGDRFDIDFGSGSSSGSSSDSSSCPGGMCY